MGLEIANLKRLILLSFALLSCRSAEVGPIEYDRSCHTGPTWCETLEAAWFNRQTSDGRTTSLCAAENDSLTYLFGTIGEEPLEQLTAPIERSQAHKGYLYRTPGSRSQFFSQEMEQSTTIVVETFRTGRVEETLFAFKVGFTEHHLLQSSKGNNCYIYIHLYDDEWARTE